ncbi:MAG: hypothetical protein SGJ02_07860 [bacterium]|nr:hypothetical protein [bacterium]
MNIPSVIAENITHHITQVDTNNLLNDIVANEPLHKLDEIGIAIMVALLEKANDKHQCSISPIILADFFRHLKSYAATLPYKVTANFQEQTMDFTRPIILELV